jgi:hypothetical protein
MDADWRHVTLIAADPVPNVAGIASTDLQPPSTDTRVSLPDPTLRAWVVGRVRRGRGPGGGAACPGGRSPGR